MSREYSLFILQSLLRFKCRVYFLVSIAPALVWFLHIIRFLYLDLSFHFLTLSCLIYPPSFIFGNTYFFWPLALYKYNCLQFDLVSSFLSFLFKILHFVILSFFRATNKHLSANFSRKPGPTSRTYHGKSHSISKIQNSSIFKSYFVT